jgi:Delta24-sterol reductase
MSVYYKSKKERKTAMVVPEAEAAIREPAYADEA